MGGSDTAEANFEIDRADISKVGLEYTSTTDVAETAVPFLLRTFASRGIVRPLAESPIHLIGHSRGGSVVSELAQSLGRRGIWVDQLTTIDPHPVRRDPDVSVQKNIRFADNYYQKNDVIDGSSAAGAHNIKLDFDNLGHTETHAYYQGTINTAAKDDGDGADIDPDWYTDATSGPRGEVGYVWSRLGAGERPADGLPSAGRDAWEVTNTGLDAWDDISISNHNAPVSLRVGQSTFAKIVFRDVSRDAALTVALDSDSNPYDGGFAHGSVTMENHAVVHEGRWTARVRTDGVTPGVYHMVAKITNGRRTRYYYAPGAITVTSGVMAIAAERSTPFAAARAIGTPTHNGDAELLEAGRMNGDLLS